MQVSNCIIVLQQSTKNIVQLIVKVIEDCNLGLHQEKITLFCKEIRFTNHEGEHDKSTEHFSLRRNGK